MIHLQNVRKEFGEGKNRITAIDDVSLSVASGEIFGIIGYSGAGKSTLIRLLNGLEQPTSGTVTVAGENISGLKGRGLREVRQKVSMVFQHFNLLWSSTVKDNVAFPLKVAGVKNPERDEKVMKLIERVGLKGRENAYPSELSGGQKQRVGIARALANDPEVLLCDEATSALDPETTDAILDLLTSINEELQLTIVLITHEMHVIRKICHRVAVMENGRVVEEGDVLQLFRSPQQDITKRFVAQVTYPADTSQAIRHLTTDSRPGTIVKLTFIGEAAEQPVLNKVMKTSGIEVNIISGSISHTACGAHGTLFLLLNGEEAYVQQAIDSLTQEGVQTEVVRRG